MHTKIGFIMQHNECATGYNNRTMIQNNECIAAIDIGTTKIVAMVGRKHPTGKVEVMAVSKTESRGVRRGMVLNVEETARDIEKVMLDVQQKTGLTFKEVFVGIAAQHIRCLKSRSYFDRDDSEMLISEEDVLRLHREVSRIAIDPREQIVCVIPQHFIVDGEADIRNPVGMTGKRIEANFNIVLCQKTSAANIDRCMQRLNLSVARLFLEPLASADAVLTDEEREAGVAMLDIGGGTTDIAVFLEGELKHAAVIPFGGFVVTKDIKEGCGILQKQAESLKIKYGSSFGSLADEDKIILINGIGGRDQKEVTVKTLANIIQARMEEIIDAAMFEISNSAFADRLHAGIVLTGGGSLLRDLPQLVRYQTGMDVKVASPCNYVSDKCGQELEHPMFATGIGLLIQGFHFLEEHSKHDSAQVLGYAKPSVQTMVTSSLQPEPSVTAASSVVSPTIEGEASESGSKRKDGPLGRTFKNWQNYLTAIFDEENNDKFKE